jgi:hypothetical protein
LSTEQLGGPLAELLAEMIPRAAAAGHKRFKMVPADDFEQAMYEKVLRDPAKYRQLLAEGRDGVIWTELRRCATKVGSEDDRYRRAQKALAEGYRPEDEEFYSRDMLRMLLPVLIEAEFSPEQAIERAANSTDAAGVRIQGSEPGTAAENYMAMLIDVTTAFGKLTGYHQRILRDYYGLDQADTENGRWERTSLASSMGLTLNALQKRAVRALDALEDLLGGKSPWLRGRREETAA